MERGPKNDRPIMSARWAKKRAYNKVYIAFSITVSLEFGFGAPVLWLGRQKQVRLIPYTNKCVGELEKLRDPLRTSCFFQFIELFVLFLILQIYSLTEWWMKELDYFHYDAYFAVYLWHMA